MTLFIFAGDMLVMAFMIGVAIWFGTRGAESEIADIAKIPLEEDLLRSDLDNERVVAR